MRYVIYGAGAIGGGIGGRLFASGRDVVLIARGEHRDAIARDGLLLCDPKGEQRLRIPVAGGPAEVDFRTGDVVVLAMKTQDVPAALADLERAGETALPVVCAQNGVDSQRMAARACANVYAMLVWMPASFLTPGEVVLDGGPFPGVLHTGRFPGGVDALSSQICRDLSDAGFVAEPDADVMRLKYRKLITNLGNAVQVAVGSAVWEDRGATPLDALIDRVRAEAMSTIEAAGIEVAREEEFRTRVVQHCGSVPVPGRQRSGASTMQSLLRGRPTVEVDYLNGEIALLGAIHGVSTPCNRVLQRIVNEMAAAGRTVGGYAVDDIHRMAADLERTMAGTAASS